MFIRVVVGCRDRLLDGRARKGIIGKVVFEGQLKEVREEVQNSGG